MTFDAADTTLTSRRRILEAGKLLFAKHGFEQTPTAAIAREAGTSESQLVRYYRTKSGLLDAIFNESWGPLNQHIQMVVVAAADAHEALVAVLETIREAFSEDPDLAALLLLEGRRTRSPGAVEFETLLRTLIHRGKRDGTFRTDVSDEAIASALIGATEAMIRDRLLAVRAGLRDPFNDADMRAIFGVLLEGL